MTDSSADAAALRSERDFLLASIADLDAEHQAGDLEDADYQTLRDGYVARAAAILRQLDQDDAAVAAPTPIDQAGKTNQVGWKRRAVTFVGAGVVAVVVGLALAQATGYRAPSDSGSGGIRQSASARLAEASTLSAEGRWDEALATYDEVLDDDPANAEALAYKGWVLNTQFGDADQANDLLAEAVAADPSYPDARVFAALLARSRGDYAAALDNVAAFDELEAVPEQMTMLVNNASLRAEVLAEVYLDQFERNGAVTIDERFDIDESARAAVVLDAGGDVVAAIATFDAVLTIEPANRTAQVGLGRRLAATPELVASSPTLAQRGMALLDEAVAAQPDDAEARAYRALARAVQDDEDGAREDLAVLDSADSLPDGLEPIMSELHAWLDP